MHEIRLGASVLFLALGLLSACDGDSGADAGPSDASTCGASSDCDDGLYCNGEESCDPTNTAADARGCVTVAMRCGAGVDCDEDADRCGAACSEPDADGDGHDATECGGDDCDDTDANRYPDNAEVCDVDGVDEDCDPETFGDRDLDDDGYVDARCCNGDECGVDCDETRRGTNPNVPEVCDGRDNDCDGEVDEELLQDVFTDADRDLHGDPDAPIDACPGRAGTSASSLDCDDGDPMTNGPQTELIDGEDNDCDGDIDEETGESTFYPDTDGDGYGDATGTTIESDTPVSGYAILPIDCDDDDAAVSPIATEVCNGVDDDCSGEADLVIGVNDWEDDDGDGYPDAACAGSSTRADCDDTDPITYPDASERCDARDNDCDGAVDESCGGGSDVDAGPPSGDDAGVGGDECADPGASGGSGTGTVLIDGSPWITPVDAYATYRVTAGEGGSFSTLEIRMTDYPNACAIQAANQNQADSRYVMVRLWSVSATDPGLAPLPATGTYPLTAYDYETGPFDQFVYTGTFAVELSGECGASGSAVSPEVTGELVLTTVSASLVEGTYTYDDGFGTITSGSFSVPIQDCAPDGAAYCCRPATAPAP